MTDDGVLPADGTLPRQEGQRDHPGSILSFDSGSAIKRITAGVKAAADRRCQVSIWGLAFTLPVKTVSNEKRIQLFDCRPQLPSEPRPVKTLGGAFADHECRCSPTRYCCRDRIR